jgi:hypothetical protein
LYSFDPKALEVKGRENQSGFVEAALLVPGVAVSPRCRTHMAARVRLAGYLVVVTKDIDCTDIEAEAETEAVAGDLHSPGSNLAVLVAVVKWAAEYARSLGSILEAG